MSCDKCNSKPEDRKIPMLMKFTEEVFLCSREIS